MLGSAGSLKDSRHFQGGPGTEEADDEMPDKKYGRRSCVFVQLCAFLERVGGDWGLVLTMGTFIIIIFAAVCFCFCLRLPPSLAQSKPQRHDPRPKRGTMFP